MERDQRRGELVRLVDVEHAAFTTARRVRDILLGIAPRLAPVVAGLATPEQCLKAIEGEINDVIQELSDLKVTAAGESRTY